MYQTSLRQTNSLPDSSEPTRVTWTIEVLSTCDSITVPSNVPCTYTSRSSVVILDCNITYPTNPVTLTVLSDGVNIAMLSVADVSSLNVAASNTVIRPDFNSALSNYSVASACTETDVVVSSGCGPTCQIYINSINASQSTLDVTGASGFVIAVGYHQLFFYYQLNFYIGKVIKAHFDRSLILDSSVTLNNSLLLSPGGSGLQFSNTDAGPYAITTAYLYINFDAYTSDPDFTVGYYVAGNPLASSDIALKSNSTTAVTVSAQLGAPSCTPTIAYTFDITQSLMNNNYYF